MLNNIKNKTAELSQSSLRSCHYEVCLKYSALDFLRIRKSVLSVFSSDGFRSSYTQVPSQKNSIDENKAKEIIIIIFSVLDSLFTCDDNVVRQIFSSLKIGVK